MSTTQVRPTGDASTLRHLGVLYRGRDDYLRGVLTFVREGIAAGEPAFVAVPEPNLEALRANLPTDPGVVAFADMGSVGRNPGRIIPAIRGFVERHRTSRVRFVGEPIWPGRSSVEICEATRHEAMLNVAFADDAVDILCPYDVTQLSPEVIEDSWRTHPTVVDGAHAAVSPHYDDPTELFAGAAALSMPPNGVDHMAIETDNLHTVRTFIRDYAVTAGLTQRRTQDLVIAANEIATNTVVHSPGDGMVRMWPEGGAVVCEIADFGHIVDPFAGRHVPDNGADHGRGLWMANQLCDLVQLRSSASGTTIRLHVLHTEC